MVCTVQTKMNSTQSFFFKQACLVEEQCVRAHI